MYFCACFDWTVTGKWCVPSFLKSGALDVSCPAADPITISARSGARRRVRESFIAVVLCQKEGKGRRSVPPAGAPVSLWAPARPATFVRWRRVAQDVSFRARHKDRCSGDYVFGVHWLDTTLGPVPAPCCWSRSATHSALQPPHPNKSL